MLKRAFDVALAAVGLAASSPLWLLCAAAVRLEDGGPVFFRQERVGRAGRVFLAWKFRSMIPNAEAATGPVQASDGDPRITRVGRVLRATAMDELPQLWNILVGDMSFVGPRPLRPGEAYASRGGVVAALADVAGYQARHAIRPGLTGLAQVYAPRDVPPAAKFRFDRLYITRRTFALDLKLITASLLITCRGSWEEPARRGRRAKTL